jgi:hypothetical protein
LRDDLRVRARLVPHFGSKIGFGGRAVYSNLPIDQLSSAVRAMLEGRE